QSAATERCTNATLANRWGPPDVAHAAPGTHLLTRNRQNAARRALVAAGRPRLLERAVDQDRCVDRRASERVRATLSDRQLRGGDVGRAAGAIPRAVAAGRE